MRTVSANERNIREWIAPLTLIGLGICLTFVTALARPGSMSVFGSLALRTAVIAVGSGIAVLACYATAAIFGIDFGLVKPGILKLAGIYAFTTAIGGLIPGGWLIGLFVFFALLAWLFDLEMWEVFLFVIVLAGVRFSVVAFFISVA